MPDLYTLTDLTTQVRRRADMENTLFVTDAEIQEYIQESYLDAYELMIESAGHEVFTRVAVDITTAAGTAIYPIYESGSQNVPVLRLVRAVINDSGVIRTLEAGARLNAITEGAAGLRGTPRRAALLGPTILRFTSSDPNHQLLLDPCPDAAYTVKVYYIPFPPDLTTTSAQNIGGAYGLVEYIVCDAAAKCLEKEKSLQEAQFMLARRERAAERLRWGMRARHGDGWGRIRDVDDEPQGPLEAS